MTVCTISLDSQQRSALNTCDPSTIKSLSVQCALARASVEFTATFVEEFAIEKVGRALTTSLAALGDISVSVAVRDDEGVLRQIAATHENLHLLTQLQIGSRQGPLWTAFETGEVIEDYRVEEHDQVWPYLGSIARAIGFRKLWAYPISSGDIPVGALEIASMTEIPLSRDRTELIRLLVASAGLSITNRALYDEAVSLNRQLQVALNTRIVIEQAKGAIAARLDIGVEDAFELLRSYARSHNQSLINASTAVINKELHIGAAT